LAENIFDEEAAGKQKEGGQTPARSAKRAATVKFFFLQNFIFFSARNIL
jgi:hypothetical protein